MKICVLLATGDILHLHLCLMEYQRDLLNIPLLWLFSFNRTQTGVPPNPLGRIRGQYRQMGDGQGTETRSTLKTIVWVLQSQSDVVCCTLFQLFANRHS